ncbi:MAG: hypothetical protein K0R39_365 [Symbiobacteriaceae bacterium]|jgi:uncharacterized membrane-anchored protein|nr:hypothetical protein [Symbiobacteriaceae bacterium]
MTGKRWVFVAAVALQVLLLLGMAGRHSYTLQTGRPIRLETAPVDPWDPFRGEYVSLNYKISQLEAGRVTMAGAPYQRGQKVWVTLRSADPYWIAVAVSSRRPQASGNEVAVQGTVQWYYPDAGPAGRPQVFIRYGIEQFYVPEGEGPELEDRRHQVDVDAVVDRFGRAAVKRVWVDGKEVQWR